MKCENCGSEMRQGARICHDCQYNHLLKRKMGSRQPVVADPPVPPTRPVIRRRPTEELVPPPAAVNVAATPASGEDNLIRFPYTPNSGVERTSGTTKPAPEESIPEWRQRVRDKVRESRGKRVEEPATVTAVPDEVKTDPNPLVESALKRIKRATPSITPIPVAQRGVASAAKALEVEIEEEIEGLTPGVDRRRVTPDPRQRPVASPQPPGVKPPAVKSSGSQSTSRSMESRPPLPATTVRGRVEPEARASAPRSQTADLREDLPAWPVFPEEVRIPAVETTETISVEPVGSRAGVTTSTTMVPEIIFGDLETESPASPSGVRHPVPGPVAGPVAGEDRRSGIEGGTAEAGRREESPIAPATNPQREQNERSEPGPVRTTRRIKPEAGTPTSRPAETKHIDTQIIGVDSSTVAMGSSEKSGLPATFWVRTLAGGCDFEIIAMSFLPIFAAYAVLNTILNSETFFLMLLLLAALTFIYQLVTLVMAGRTYGMAMLNLRLISLTGDEPEKVTRQQLMMRAWAATIAFLIPPVNLIIRQTNERRLSLPDLVSNTAPVEI